MSSKTTYYLLAAIMSVFLISIMAFGKQKDFYLMFPLYSMAFVSYALILFRNYGTLKQLILLGIVLRLMFVYFFPNLSDDMYRFYWDGRLMVEGINPYGVLPSEVISLRLKNPDINIFHKLNSPEYYTIYPPVSQIYFAVGAIFGDVYKSAMIMKVLFLITEIGGLVFMLKILDKLHLDRRLSMIYFLNPLIMLEGVGNLHFEVVMIAFLCLSIYFIFEKKWLYGSIWMAMSIGVKLVPLILLPFLWFMLKGKERLVFFVVLSVILCIIFFPVTGSVEFGSFMSSLDLYFRKFEFNGSIYYVLRSIGMTLTGYNLISYIGPALALVTLSFSFWLAAKKAEGGLPEFMKYSLMVGTVYFLLATTVHPWYISTLVFFSVFTDIKYGVFWSYLIFITYVNYSCTPFHENMWAVASEYAILLILIILEYKRRLPPSLSDSWQSGCVK
ncbi:MAG: hypothetical protein H7X99_07080 [Saprospiraceae bacterium]|nr:hypothetical protein [Saprospiraceae bacterium]